MLLERFYLLALLDEKIETNVNTNKVIMTKLYGVSCCHCLCHHLCCQLLCLHYKNNFRVHLIILYGRTMRTVHILIPLFATLLFLLLLLFIVIYDCVGKYDETIIMDLYVGE